MVKVGDKVRIISANGHGYKIGELAEVTEIATDYSMPGVIWARVVNGYYPGLQYQVLLPHNYEKVAESKPDIVVGDNVIVTGRTYYHAYPIGSIVEVKVLHGNGRIEAYGRTINNQGCYQTLEAGDYELVLHSPTPEEVEHIPTDTERAESLVSKIAELVREYTALTK